MKLTHVIDEDIKAKIDVKIKEDITLLKKLFGSKLKRVALFGSCIRKPIQDATDIDIVLFLDHVDVLHATEIIEHGSFHYRTDSKQIRLSYGGGGGIIEADTKEKCYDILLLDHHSPNTEFLKHNQDDILYM